MLLSHFSRLRLCATPQTAAHQDAPSLRVSRQDLLPYHIPNNSNPVTRGEQGFGSTGDQVVCFTQQILSDRPTCKAEIQAKMFSEILDSRADISIITSPQWPADWPLTEPQEKIIRLGGTSTICSKCNSSSLPRARQTTCSLPTFYCRHSL